MSCRKWEVQIFRRQEGALDQAAEARLSRHLKSCIRCREVAESFAELDDLFVKSEEPSLPPFLKDRIVSTIMEEMREDSVRGSLSRFFHFFLSWRPAVVGAVLVVGIGLGVATGWDLARSMTDECTGASYDLLSLAGLGGEGSGSSLDFILMDSTGRAGQ